MTATTWLTRRSRSVERQGGIGPGSSPAGVPRAVRFKKCDNNLSYKQYENPFLGPHIEDVSSITRNQMEQNKGSDGECFFLEATSTVGAGTSNQRL